MRIKNRRAYLTTEHIELMKDRDRAFKTARHLNDDDSWTQVRILRSAIQAEIFRAKKAYIRQSITLTECDSKKNCNLISK